MESTTEIQSIASESAKIIVEQFLQTIPSELKGQLSQSFFEDIGTDLEADIQSCLNSRLQWSMQSAYAEISVLQQEHQQPEPIPRLNYLPPEPLQQLPKRKQQRHQQTPNSNHAPRTVDNPNEPMETENYVKTEHYLTLKKSPNRQRRRRRRSAAAEYQESLLNATS